MYNKINKHLEDLFELETNTEDNDMLTNEQQQITTTALTNLEKIEMALPQVKGLEASDNELDDLADLAINSYKDLMDMGQQVEPKFSAEIFNSAGTMLGHAITARVAKVNKKLKMIDQQLKKAQIDLKTEKPQEDATPTSTNVIEGKAQVLDRNELLKVLLAKKENE